MLTKLACRAFAVLVLVAGVAAGIHVGLADDGDVQDPRQLAEDELRAQDMEQQSSRDWHRSYSQTAADTDASGKAESIAQVATDQAKALDETYADAQPAEEEETEDDDSDGGSGVDVGPIPADCDEYSGNKEIGCALLLDNGFGLDQMPCLETLWDHESGWNETASNGGSGAYGIPQALPGNKMSSHGDDWETNPATQIAWGLDYISGRYNDPCGAYEFFQANNWY